MLTSTLDLYVSSTITGDGSREPDGFIRQINGRIRAITQSAKIEDFGNGPQFPSFVYGVTIGRANRLNLDILGKCFCLMMLF